MLAGTSARLFTLMMNEPATGHTGRRHPLLGSSLCGFLATFGVGLVLVHDPRMGGIK